MVHNLSENEFECMVPQSELLWRDKTVFHDHYEDAKRVLRKGSLSKSLFPFVSPKRFNFFHSTVDNQRLVLQLPYFPKIVTAISSI